MRADLRRAYLMQAILSKASVEEALWDKTVLPDGTEYSGE